MTGKSETMSLEPPAGRPTPITILSNASGWPSFRQLSQLQTPGNVFAASVPLPLSCAADHSLRDGCRAKLARRNRMAQQRPRYNAKEQNAEMLKRFRLWLTAQNYVPNKENAILVPGLPHVY